MIRASRRFNLLEELRAPYVIAEGGEATWSSLSGADSGRRFYWRRGGAAPSFFTLEGVGLLFGSVEDYTPPAGHEWERDEPVLDVDGELKASIWRASDGSVALPFDPDDVALQVRSERYVNAQRARSSHTKRATMSAYYGLRPVLPRSVQIALRRAYAPVQARVQFPRWPVEPALHDMLDFVARTIAEVTGPYPTLAAWPDGLQWALVLTHDVETARGRDAVVALSRHEEELGFRSSWNFVSERYDVPHALREELASRGFEVGVHGLFHDGRDLDHKVLPDRLPAMRANAAAWNAVGFRSPATHREWDTMPMLGFDYDSSSPDTDPFEPRSGGCCSWLPFFNSSLVELPITLPQDHTLFVILRRDALEEWTAKVDFLRERGGMALLITHPDYLLDDARLGAYVGLLERLHDSYGMWSALPREVAQWWRRRHASSIVSSGAGCRVTGPASEEARIVVMRPRQAE
jgi:hypothetical protein